MRAGQQGFDGKVGVDRLPVKHLAPKAPWLQQLDAIQASQSRIEAKLDTLIEALAEDLDEVSQSLEDGSVVARRRDETQSLG